MATWSELRQRGYGVIYALTIEGIPYVWTERHVYRVDSAAEPGVPSGYTLSRALSVLEGDAVSCEINRETGIADGRAWDVTLAWDVLEREGLLSTLFTTPSATATLATPLTDDTTPTTVTVDDTTDFDASGGLYIGREHMTYTGKTSTTFTGVSRGVAGLIHYHDTSSWVSYNVLADVPLYFRGRLTTLILHLVSPEGRILDSTIGEVGTYSRQLWRGFVAEEPRPQSAGMQLRCLPLTALLQREIGYEARGEVYSRAADELLVVGAGDRIAVSITDNSGNNYTAQLPLDFGALALTSLTRWCAQATADADTTFNGETWAVSNVIPVDFYYDPDRHAIRVQCTGTSIAEFTVTGQAWFLPSGEQQGTAGHPVSANVVPYTVLLDVEYNTEHSWLPVEFEAAEDGQQIAIPSAGIARIESGGAVELAYYDQAEAFTVFDRNVALRLARRGINGVRVDPWADGGSVSVVTGAAGSVWQVVESLLTSSGITSERGTYDVLAFGLGLGLPSSYVDTDTTRSAPLASDYGWIVSDGQASIADLVGGWYALTSSCLVQRRDLSDDALKLTVVSTIPATRAATANEVRTDTLDDTNVIQGSHSTPEPVVAPNSVLVEGAREGQGARTFIVQDVARIQAEGLERWEVTASGIRGTKARLHGQSLLASMEGQAILSLDVPPWVEIQIGDPVSLETAHPAVYDWGGATRSPSSVPARVLGWSYDLFRESASLTLAIDARSLGPRYLCPSLTVTSRDAADTISVTSDPRDWLVAGESVLIYTPGDEASESQTLVISTMTSTTIVFTTSTVGAWVASGARVTYPVYGSASTRQQAWAYVRADTRWS